MTNVVATDAGSRRRLLAVEVTVSFTVIVPTQPGSEQATFDSVVNDLSAAASAGGALTTGALASLATVETAAYVPPTAADMATVNGADSCVGTNVIFDSQKECRCEDWYQVSYCARARACQLNAVRPPPCRLRLYDLTTYSHPTTRACPSGRLRCKRSPTSRAPSSSARAVRRDKSKERTGATATQDAWSSRATRARRLQSLASRG